MPIRETSEEALVAASRGGSSEAFGHLAAHYYESAYRTALYVLREPEAARDEVQNAFVKALEHIGSFREEAKFSTWLSRIVMNCCLMRLRRERVLRVQSLEDLAVAEGRAVAIPDPCPSQEAELGRREVMDRLRREVSRVPPLLRRVLELRDIGELPMDVVAAELGISVPAAKSRLLRARQELKKRMEPHGGRGGPATLLA